jgi:quinoprotein glucose dehydrogenase
MRSRSALILSLAISLLLVLCGAGLSALLPKLSSAAKGNGADWPRYAGDLAGSRFSTLKEINTQNVAKLAPAWTISGVGSEETPIVVNGVMYASTTTGVVAVEADSGKEIWRYGAAPAAGGGGRGGARGAAPAGRGRGAAAVPADGQAPPLPSAAPTARGAAAQAPARGGATPGAPNAALGTPSSRGVAYWPGEGTIPARLFFTAGPRLAALRVSDGQLDTTFGMGGSVNMAVPYSGVPTIFKNLIFIGATNGEVSVGDQPGDTRAFDARTGAKLWDFKSVAQPGDKNHSSWLDDGWKGRQGVNHWGWYMTVDEDRGILYTGFGTPAGNYWGGDRPGNNLYANSVVAIDASTGKYLWHFQTVHHDLWDSDIPSPPVLLDVQQGNRTIPALAIINKTANMFILDRTNGKPLFGVKERAVAKGDAPGEWYSPTQPFPTKPPALGRTSFTKEDIVTADDTTPEHAKACQDLYDKSGGYFNAGPYTPFLYHEAGTPPKSSIQFPGNGGPNWGGPAADPTLGYVFVFTQDAGLVGWIEKKVPGGNYGNGTQGSPIPYDRASVNGPGPYSNFTANGMPCQKPPWGQLWAVNAATGDIAWHVTLGVSDNLPAGKQHTGRGGSAGPISTAGGLVFIAATSDSRFRALDSKTGKELWVARLNANGSANPMTYQARDGKQYVAIAAAGTVNVFALP